MDYPKFVTLSGLHLSSGVPDALTRSLYVETAQHGSGFLVKCWGCGYDRDITYAENLGEAAQEHASACTGLGVEK